MTLGHADSADLPDEQAMVFVRPHQVRKGRGAVSSPAGRFERIGRTVEPGDLGEQGEADEDTDSGPLLTEVREEVARSIISRNTSPDIRFEQSINPYRGCEHGCVYCYARPGHAYLGWSPGLDFETRLVAKVNAPELLATELARDGYRCSPIAIGAVTDAWQPIERTRLLTRRCLEVLERTGHPATMVTKGSLVERDIDLLARMAARKQVFVMITLTTLDPTLARLLEPRAPAPWRRLQTLRRLAQAGIPVGLSLAPVIPFVNEPEIEALLEAAAEAGARHVNYVVLRLPLELRDVFVDWLKAHFPDRAGRVMGRLRDMRGGEDSDARFGWRMKGEGPWADMIRMRIDARARRLGMSRKGPELSLAGFQPGPQGRLF